VTYHLTPTTTSSIAVIRAVGTKAIVLLLATLLATILAQGLAFAQSSPSPQSTAIYNVKNYGATGAAHHVTDGVISSGSLQLTSATAIFSPADVGAPIYVLGANTGYFPGLGSVARAPLSSTITSVLNSHTALLATPATVSTQGASVTWGPNDTQALQSLLDAVGSSGGGTIYFPAGIYQVTGQPGLNINYPNMHLTGVGAGAIILNSSILFSAQNVSGTIYTDQRGQSALYAGQPPPAGQLSNIEVDHLTFEDNGQAYNYSVWGPEGNGVIGCNGTISNLSFHDLTIQTNYLVGITTNLLGGPLSIYNNTIISNGNHGMYLTGIGQDGPSGVSVYDNVVKGIAKAPRIGLAVKASRNVNIYRNDISNVDFEGIAIVGDAVYEASNNVVIRGNYLHDLNPIIGGEPDNTTAIRVTNATNVTIDSNQVERTNYDAIGITGDLYNIENITISNNTINQAGYGIDVHFNPNPCGSGPCGSVSNVNIVGNTIADLPIGIFFENVGGINNITGNSMTGGGAGAPASQQCGTGFIIEPLSSSSTTFAGNTGTYCSAYYFTNIINEGNVYNTNTLQ
jgi:polygalacturonase